MSKDVAQKIHVYADETGQDTEGTFFLVAVVIVPTEIRERVANLILRIENQSKRGQRKWSESSKESRKSYLGLLLQQDLSGVKMSSATFSDSTEYSQLTAKGVTKCIADVMGTEANYKATILVDGLNKAEREKIKPYLKRKDIRYKKIRGPKDESSALLRLADSLAGMLRNAANDDTAMRVYEDALYQAEVLVR